MGCGGSKEEVATGNTVSSQSLQKKKSDVLKNTTTGADANPVSDKAEEIPKVTDDVKDVALSAAAEEDGKFIAAESPDSYFSSTKDEEAVEGITAPLAYFSPPSGPEGGKVEAVAVVEGEEVEAGKKVSASKGGEEIATTKDDEKLNSKDSADLEETILMEKESEATVAGKKNVGEGESDSLAH